MVRINLIQWIEIYSVSLDTVSQCIAQTCSLLTFRSTANDYWTVCMSYYMDGIVKNVAFGGGIFNLFLLCYLKLYIAI